MRAPFARAVFSVIALAACGGGSPPSEPDPPVFTGVTVTPDSTTLFTVPPVTTVTLQAVALDQYGAMIGDIGAAVFSSDAETVASAGSDGTITAVSPGTAVITATMTQGEITHSANATVAVRVPPSGAAVAAPDFSFRPSIVDVAAGGQVSWTMGEHFHDVVFSTPGAPENIQPSRLTTISRVFLNAGNFGYRCLIHTGMNGLVRVH